MVPEFFVWAPTAAARADAARNARLAFIFMSPPRVLRRKISSDRAIRARVGGLDEWFFGGRAVAFEDRRRRNSHLSRRGETLRMVRRDAGPCRQGAVAPVDVRRRNHRGLRRRADRARALHAPGGIYRFRRDGLRLLHRALSPRILADPESWRDGRP